MKEEEKRQIPGGSEENTHHTGKVTERQLSRKIGIQNQWGRTEDCSSKKADVFLPLFPFKQNCFHLFAYFIFKWFFKVQFNLSYMDAMLLIAITCFEFAHLV